MKKQMKWYEFETEIQWTNIVFIVGLHLTSLYSFIIFPYREQKVLVLWAIIMYYLAGLGAGAGVHRLWTHRSYKAKLPLRIFLATCYYSSGMNRIFDWVRDHRVHHKFTDTDADPHNINRGFWFSHVGWLMLKKKPEVRQHGKGIDMSDVLADPVVRFFDNNYVILKTLLTFVLPVVIPVYIFNQDLKWAIVSQIFMRYPALLNVIWSINSFAHMFGYRSYDKSIRPADNIWIGIAGGGEGWHNYHHAFPCDYKGAECSSVFLNPTALWIEIFTKIGWAYDLKQVTPEHIKKIVERKGDGTHPIYHSNGSAKSE